MFPVFKNKKFHDLLTGKIISVIDQFEDVAILEGKGRVNVTKLLDKNLYEEYIDPTTFFNSGSLQNLAEKIKSIPNDALVNIQEEGESIILPYDPEEEKRQILEKARQMNPMNSVQSQIEKFRDILDEDIDVPTRTIVTNPEPFIQHTQELIQQPQQTQQRITQVEPVLTQEEDPMVKLFKNVKRKQDFKVSLVIEDKIPRPDFIEMMEDSYEYSLIDFLAEEFTKKLLSEPEKIKETIKKELNLLVYKEEQVSIQDLASKQEEKLTVKKTKPAKNKKEDDTSVIR